MKIEILYILDCPWCVKTKKLIRESLRELGIKSDIEEILIDSDEKAKEYNFVGSPTIRINGKDIQEDVSKGKCLPCEELAELTKGTTEFIKQECRCGCRIYFYKGKQYSYPPKEMIKKAIRNSSYSKSV
jgi:glutaredoxin